eukprot:7384108-Prymnesium_polylepis.2
MACSSDLSKPKVEFSEQGPLTAVSSHPMLKTSSVKRLAISRSTLCTAAYVSPPGSAYNCERLRAGSQARARVSIARGHAHLTPPLAFGQLASPGRITAIVHAGGGRRRLDGHEAARVTGHVKLGDDADATIGSVGDDGPHIVLRVVAGVQACEGGGEVRVRLALNAEAAHVGCVQVEHVQLGRRHRVEQVVQEWQREEAAAAVDHQAAPRVGRCVLDRDGVVVQRRGRFVHQLHERLEAVDGTVDRRGDDRNACRRNRQR